MANRKHTDTTAAPLSELAAAAQAAANPPTADVVDEAEEEVGAADASMVLANAGAGFIVGVTPDMLPTLYAGFDRAPITVKLKKGDTITGRFMRFGRKQGKPTLDELTGEEVAKVYTTVVLDFLHVYRRWPAPTPELKAARAGLLKGVGLALPVEWF